MSHHKLSGTQASSEPQRPLRSDFTDQILRRARIAKTRRVRKQQLQALIKEPFSMKSLKFLRTVPGAALALAVVATGSAGAYALSNWFNGDVTVRQNDSVLSVDLSSCKGNLPPGVDSQDRRNVQFKIMGSPHLSAANLESQLLAQCELDAVRDFYRTNGQGDKYLVPATVKSANDTSITFEYVWGGEKREQTLAFASNSTVYKQGVVGATSDLRIGASAVIAANQPANWQENINPLDKISEAQSVFVTQHDVNIAPGASKKGFYEDNNIMPLDWYDQIQY